MRHLTAEVVGSTRAALGEAPLWNRSGRTLVWVDIEGGEIHFTEPGGETHSSQPPGAPGALAESRRGLVVGLPDGLYLMEGWERLAAVEPDDAGTRMNDCLVDPDGNLLMGTMAWDTSEGGSSLYRIRPGGETERLLEGKTISNGMAWLDGDLLHVDTPTRLIGRYPYRPDAPLGDGTVFLDLGDERGLPDGMCMDAAGCLWVALYDGAQVRRYTPGGDLDTVVDLPVSRPTSCAFGGPDLGTLYVTSALPEGGPDSEAEAGHLFATSPGVDGAPLHLFGG